MTFPLFCLSENTLFKLELQTTGPSIHHFLLYFCKRAHQVLYLRDLVRQWETLCVEALLSVTSKTTVRDDVGGVAPENSACSRISVYPFPPERIKPSVYQLLDQECSFPGCGLHFSVHGPLSFSKSYLKHMSKLCIHALRS